ncbi:MAG: arsenic resistance N-acetyltransferase ArsN2 [Promethearchaeota archaeon]
MIKIRTANHQELKSVFRLLRKVNLPLEGVADHFDNFFIAQEEDQLVGCIGIELYENVGLIRSVAVDPSFQGRGIGNILVDAIQKFGKEKKLKAIYLLTETAADFFSKLDYMIIPRDKADDRIKKSIEFTSACPASATCMMKILT